MPNCYLVLKSSNFQAKNTRMLHSIELCLGLKRVRGVCSHIDSTQSVKPSTKVQTKKSTGILGSSPWHIEAAAAAEPDSSTSMLRSHMLFCFEKAPSRHTSPVVCYQALLVCPWA